MTAGSEVLDRLAAALRAGDRAGFVACFSPSGALVIPHPAGELSYQGTDQLANAAATLFEAFVRLDYTALRRYLTPTQTVEEAALSGRHVGSFAGHPAAGEVVRVSIRLVGELTDEHTLGRLAVWADLSSLWSQLGESLTMADAANVAATAARVPTGDELHVLHGADRIPGFAASPPVTGRRRSMRVIVTAAAGLFALSGGLALALTHHSPGGTSAAQVGPLATLRATGHPTPTPGQSLPAIATATPSAPPSVQAGVQLVLSADVLFDFGSGTLTAAASNSVLQLANRIRSAHVRGVIQINGYTDDVGPADYDLALSRTRALAVAVALQQQLAGVPVTLLPQGFGKTNPLVPNDTSDGRARNRRVTIVLPVNR